MRTIRIVIVNTGSSLDSALEESMFSIVTRIQRELFISAQVSFIKFDNTFFTKFAAKPADFCIGVNVDFSKVQGVDTGSVLPIFFNLLIGYTFEHHQGEGYLINNIVCEDNQLDIDQIYANFVGYIQKACTVKSALEGQTKNIRFAPEIIAIAASTGGPDAIFKVISELSPTIQIPIVITQHMPADFIPPFVAQLQKTTQRQVVLGKDGLLIAPNTVYVAEGDQHLVFQRRDNGVYCRSSKESSVHFVRPAADPMFLSLANIYAHRVLAIVLTGMGSDGAVGAKELFARGSKILVQDEESSVVWSMPSAVYHSGVKAQIISLSNMAQTISKMTMNATKSFLQGGS